MFNRYNRRRIVWILLVGDPWLKGEKGTPTSRKEFVSHEMVHAYGGTRIIPRGRLAQIDGFLTEQLKIKPGSTTFNLVENGHFPLRGDIVYILDLDANPPTIGRR
jgi:hypothetical protein